jgi:tetratricopeptide (TPR) repeat protein
MPDSLVPPPDTLPADLGELIARCRELPLPRLVEAVRADQVQRWRAGLRMPAEAYLEAFPPLVSSAEDSLVLIWGEVLLRKERGEAPQPGEYQQRFPMHAEALAVQFELQGHLDRTPEAPTLLPRATSIPGAAHLPEVPGYEILGELGRGGMGVVYKARHIALDRLVALKMVLSGEFAGEQERARFRTEALAVARLQHPNVVQVFEVGEHQGHPYLALQYVEGGSLADRLRSGPQPPREAAELVERLARAVQAAHDKGVIHRDLKPANVLLAADGTPRIADFGLAKRLDAQSTATQTGAIVGTPAYMAPEQAGGKSSAVGLAVDVWALGAVLYECLTGRPPFLGSTPTDILLRVLSDEPAPPRQLNPAVPRDLETIALKCLRKEPAKRYATAGDLADDLRRFLRDEPIRARPLSLTERLWRRRRRLLAAGLALLVLLVVATQGLLGWRQQRRDRAYGEALAQGLRHLEAQQGNEALACFDEAVRLRPDSASALTERGIAHVARGDHDRALADYNEALRLDPRNAVAYRRRGWVFLTAGRYEEALSDLSESLQLESKATPAWKMRARVNLNLRRWSDAASDIESALGIEPRERELYELRSILHAAQGQWTESVRDYALTNPLTDEALFAQAAAALAGGHEAKYRDACGGLLSLAGATNDAIVIGRPFSPARITARAFALAEHPAIDRKRLLDLSEAGPRIPGRPDNIFLMRIKALVWLRTGDIDHAMRQANACLKSHPHYSPGINHLLLSIAHSRRSEPREASIAFERAVKAGVPVNHVHDTLEYQVLLREARQGRSKP